MDEIASLSQEIEFHEKFRGYDPDEVDAYVDRVRKTAALAMGRLSELHERVDASESLISSGRAKSAEETLGRTLILAQQTADAVVQEAEAESARLTAEAADHAAATLDADEEQSSRILAEAETDRREIIRQAEADAKSAATEARDQLQADVSGLTTTREFLEDDIAILEKHVREQRANLSLAVSSLTELIEQPESFRLEPAPVTSGITPATPETTASNEVAPIFDEQESDEQEPNLDDDESEPSDQPVDLTDPDQPDSGTAMIDEVIDLDIERFDDLAPEEPEVDPLAIEPEPPRLMTAADLDDQHEMPALAVPLFADAASGDHSEHFAQHVVGLSEGDMLADDDDDALSAFFDQDDDPDRSWFGRRG